MVSLMGAQPNKLPLFLAAFGVLLLIATIYHQYNGVPESWRATLAGEGVHHKSGGFVLRQECCCGF